MLAKIKLEKQFWRFENSSDNMSGLASDVEFMAEQKKHHKVFTKKNGVYQIMHFLTNQRNDVENWLRMNTDSAIEHAGNKENHPIFGRGLKYQIKKQRRKLKPEGEDGFEESKKHKKKKAPKDDDGDNVQVGGSQRAMLKTFQEEELGSGYIVSDTDIYLAQRKGTMISNRLKMRDMVSMTIVNPELRSLSIAAFLRCIYASIDSAPDAAYHENAIANLKGEKIFTQLT